MQGFSTAELKAIPRETIEMAQKIRQIEQMVSEHEGGNAEFTIRLKVVGGKISRFLQIAGKWFPWG